MKMLLKILKWTGIALLLIIAGFVIAVYALQNKKFDAPFPDIHASTDSAVIARGRYLVNGPAHCSGCHTSFDNLSLIDKGEEAPLLGGFEFKLPIGSVYAKNITPDKETGIGNMKDEEIARALRYGVKPDGTALLDFMPFQNLSDDDLTAVISYLRSIPPIKNKVPDNHFNFLGKAVIAFMIKPISPAGTPEKSVKQDTTAEYGEYLARNVANCRGCHTNRSLMTGEYIGVDFAGGGKFPTDTNANVIFCPPNLTPAKTSIISQWDFETFKNRFHNGKMIEGTIMPWGPFRRMSDDELLAIWKYLRSLTPVENETGPYKQFAKKS